MIRFTKDIYRSKSVKNISLAKWRIRTGRGSFGAYLVVANPDSRSVEFFHNGVLKQKALHKRDYTVVGLAGSREEAVELIEQMLSDAYAKTGKYDVYGYLMRER